MRAEACEKLRSIYPQFSVNGRHQHASVANVIERHADELNARNQSRQWQRWNAQENRPSLCATSTADSAAAASFKRPAPRTTRMRRSEQASDSARLPTHHRAGAEHFVAELTALSGRVRLITAILPITATMCDCVSESLVRKIRD